MANVFITREIPTEGLTLLENAGHSVDISKKDRVLTKEELIDALHRKQYDAVLCTLNNTVDEEVMDAAATVKIFANYAVGFNNIDIEAAKTREVTVTNTPGILTDAVAEHTFALLLALAKRVVESDSFVRRGGYEGWAPTLFLGTLLREKTIGLLGAGRIGARVAEIASCFGMYVLYYDVKRNKELEAGRNILFEESLESLLKKSDVVSIHVPLLESTHHLLNSERLQMMKKTTLLINTSRGPIIDERALVATLKSNSIRGAALDVFENEPKITTGLSELNNVILTPHIASATIKTRTAMSIMAAKSIVDFLEGKTPQNVVV